jgi:heme A synthase
MTADTLLAAHRTLAYVTIAWMVVCAAYGVVSHHRNPTLLSPAYRAVLGAGATMLALQAVLGLWLLLSGFRPATPLHTFLYGGLSFLVLPGTYLYIRKYGHDRPNMAFAMISLFLAVFLVRAAGTG